MGKIGLQFVFPISSHVAILRGSFIIILLLAFMTTSFHGTKYVIGIKGYCIEGLIT